MVKSIINTILMVFMGFILVGISDYLTVKPKAIIPEVPIYLGATAIPILFSILNCNNCYEEKGYIHFSKLTVTIVLNIILVIPATNLYLTLIPQNSGWLDGIEIAIFGYALIIVYFISVIVAFSVFRFKVSLLKNKEK